MRRIPALVQIALAIALISMTSKAPAALPQESVQTSEARAVVVRYFTALESRRFHKACTLLGHELRVESGGASCAAFLELGMPDPLVWELLGSRPARDGVAVRLRLGQNELDHVRMRTWLAIVRLEAGTPKIVETRLLR